MATRALSAEERIGLIAAVALHAALAAMMVLHPPKPPAAPLPDRIAVTISDDVGLTSTAPEPSAQAAPEVAPQLGEAQPEPPDDATTRIALPPPVPAPRAAPAPRPTPKPVATPRPTPAAQPQAKTGSRRGPGAPLTDPAVAKRANAGASRVGNDFLKGVAGSTANGRSSTPAAAAIGPAVRSSLSSAITRQLKPYWAAPQGADAELLVTVLAFELDPDGSLRGRPRVVRQSGVNDANRAQADRHAEQAIRAVELAAPFELPEQYFQAWKRVSAFRFDRRLSQ